MAFMSDETKGLLLIYALGGALFAAIAFACFLAYGCFWRCP